MAHTTLNELLDRVKRVQLFGLDTRSLALARISLALIVLFDLTSKARFLFSFYGADAIAPPPLSLGNSPGLYWSVHTILPDIFLPALFVMHTCAAVLLLVGWRTRLASIAVFFFTTSLHQANPYILDSGAPLLRTALFLLIFLPTNASCSIDAVVTKKERKTLITTPWTAAYLLQIALMYFFASLHKTGSAWADGTAVYYVLSLDHFASSIGKFTYQFPLLTSALTFGTVYLQRIAPFLLFFPLYTSAIRGGAIGVLIFFHLGLVTHLHFIGLFSFTAIALLSGAIPSVFWDKLPSLSSSIYRFNMGRRTSYLPALLSHKNRGLSLWTISASRYARTASAGAALLFVTCILLWNIADIPQTHLKLPQAIHGTINTFGLNQSWGLFTSERIDTTFWPVVAGIFENGETRDLWSGGILTEEKPPRIPSLFPSGEWHNYMRALRTRAVLVRPFYARSVCKTWNTAHPDNKLISVTLNFMTQKTKAHYGHEPIEVTSGGTYACEDVLTGQ